MALIYDGDAALVKAESGQETHEDSEWRAIATTRTESHRLPWLYFRNGYFLKPRLDAAFPDRL
jgi:hypothetical protein